MTTPSHHAARELERLGILLPTPPRPVAAYIPARSAAGLLFVSGQLPLRDGSLTHTGAVPDRVSREDAYQCARLCAINGLATAAEAAGGLERLAGVVRVGCFVNAAPDFADHAPIANGASELLAEVFGDAGRHARAAVGCSSLPLDAPVEVEFLFELAG